jgi:hypothetical protein
MLIHSTSAHLLGVGERRRERQIPQMSDLKGTWFDK